ncbi:MAG: hypothetical protein FJ028_01930, partial [Chloroflexi bacterium]|nr:hypothetical protein [Chloroflexota bacterium]
MDGDRAAAPRARAGAPHDAALRERPPLVGAADARHQRPRAGGGRARPPRLDVARGAPRGRGRAERGELRCFVATGSLELGIDIGTVDLVICVESPRGIALGLQRVGRSGHLVGQTSRGRIIPKFRGDLVECAAIAKGMLEGDVEPVRMPHDQLGVLAMLSGKYPAEEFGELRPRVVWDRSSGVVRGRPGASRLALVSGGTIPDRGQLAVVHAITGAIPTVPFWKGDALGRQWETGVRVARLLSLVRASLDDPGVVEQLRDELGDRRIVVHAPFGRMVLRPWSMALREALCRDGRCSDISVTDDGIHFRLAMQDTRDAIDLIRRVDPTNLEEHLYPPLSRSQLFAARFRENAQRAPSCRAWGPGGGPRHGCSACARPTCSRSPAAMTTSRSSTRPCARPSRTGRHGAPSRAPRGYRRRRGGDHGGRDGGALALRRGARAPAPRRLRGRGRPSAAGVPRDRALARPPPPPRAPRHPAAARAPRARGDRGGRGAPAAHGGGPARARPGRGGGPAHPSRAAHGRRARRAHRGRRRAD